MKRRDFLTLMVRAAGAAAAVQYVPIAYSQDGEADKELRAAAEPGKQRLKFITSMGDMYFEIPEGSRFEMIAEKTFVLHDVQIEPPEELRKLGLSNWVSIDDFFGACVVTGDTVEVNNIKVTSGV